MNPIRRGVMTAAIAGSLLAGGAVGASVFGAASSGAATSTTQTSTGTTQTSTSGSAAPTQPPHDGAPPSGTFKSNEDPAHEAKESAQREKEETEGKFPTTSP
jgi:hypothetical protein